MHDVSTRSPRFWETVSEHVTTKVEHMRLQKGDARDSLLVYLRDLEAVARRECRCRDTIQIIASGRHLLGDLDDLAPADGSPQRVSGHRRRLSEASLP